MIISKVAWAGLFIASAFNIANQNPLPIQRALVADSVDTYKSTSKVTQTLQSPFGEFPFTINSSVTYLLKTNKIDVDKGVADVQFTSTVDTLDGGDSPITNGLNNKKPGPITQLGTIDKFGRLSLKPPEKVDKEMMIFAGISGGLQSSLFVELPDHPVKVGDSWDIIVPKGDYTGDANQKIKATLTGEKKVDGKDAWTIDLSGIVDIKFDSAKLGPPDPAAASVLDKFHVLVDGTTTMKGSALVDKATGKTLGMDSTSDLKTKIELPDEGDTTGQASGTVVTSLKLQS